LSPEAVDKFKDLLRVFSTVAEISNATFCLYAGSLLGYQRINTMLPWDDDLDLAMLEENEEKVVKLISKMVIPICNYRFNQSSHNVKRLS